MALVAYDNSDSSEYEDDENENATFATIPKKSEVPGPSTVEETPATTESNAESTPNLFNFLPQPSTKKPTVIEEDDEFLHKKEKAPDGIKPRAKITVPSLSDFKDVESMPAAKPRTTNGRKSGLLSMLPQPKNSFTTTTTKSLIPHVLTQTNVKKKPLPSPIKPKQTKIANESDESDNDEFENDFFSINKPVELPMEDLAATEIKEPDEPKRSRLESYFKKDPVVLNEVAPEAMDSYEYAEAGTSNNGYVEQEGTSGENVVLDEEAILKLCGTRGKRKREDIQIVDVNQTEVLAEAREWLLKGLMDDTSKRISSSKKKGNEPTSQQKRKHQITYLAHQAKANEAELQNQWANSRMSRRQAQNKYGF